MPEKSSPTDEFATASDLEMKSPGTDFPPKVEFFQDATHFHFLREILIPKLNTASHEKFNVWCCTSATGEDPYSISICLREGLADPESYKILATDADQNALNMAQSGVYKNSRLGALPENLKRSAFAHGTGDISDWVRIKASYKQNVVFKMHNLADPSVPNASFDLIVCRNFSSPSQHFSTEIVIQKLFLAAKPNAYLFVGSADLMTGIKHDWTVVSPTIFQKVIATESNF